MCVDSHCSFLNCLPEAAKRSTVSLSAPRDSASFCRNCRFSSRMISTVAPSVFAKDKKMIRIMNEHNMSISFRYSSIVKEPNWFRCNHRVLQCTKC